MKMRDIMRPPHWSVRSDAPLSVAERIIARRRVRELPVVESGTLVGMLSAQDILDYRADAEPGERWWRAPACEAMRPAPLTAGPDDLVSAVSERLAASAGESLPVVERGFLIGIVSATDVLDAELRAVVPRARSRVTAADAMTDTPVTVKPTDSLIEAANLMVEHQIRHLPVLEDGRLVGMLSDRDIRTIAGDPVRFVEARDSGAEELRVCDAMTEDTVTVPADRPITEIATDLIDEEVGALPVVDPAGKVIGVVSYVDALRVLAGAAA
jgi:CBS domain-containing protein